MAMNKKAYTVTTKLQALAVAEKTSKKAAVRNFSVEASRICSAVVMLTALTASS